MIQKPARPPMYGTPGPGSTQLCYRGFDFAFKFCTLTHHASLRWSRERVSRRWAPWGSAKKPELSTQSILRGALLAWFTPGEHMYRAARPKRKQIPVAHAPQLGVERFQVQLVLAGEVVHLRTSSRRRGRTFTNCAVQHLARSPGRCRPSSPKKIREDIKRLFVWC
jgi:hypothetical protein